MFVLTGLIVSLVKLSLIVMTSEKLYCIEVIRRSNRNSNPNSIPNSTFRDLKLERGPLHKLIKIKSIELKVKSLAQLQNNIVIAVNQAYLDFGQDIELHQGDHIAIIPPLSGG
ncbi:hypothetical protein QZH41_002817 [Actinostola sp. cb2023]|nr:hypothetical protein QZH41_002817 [Actinostola sp. cb2023]